MILFLSFLCFSDKLVSLTSDLLQPLGFFKKIIFVCSGLMTFILKVKMLAQISAIKEFCRCIACGTLFCDSGDK